MSRPCQNDHELSPGLCRLCAWCVDDSEKGRKYRQSWGEPEPVQGPGLLELARNFLAASVAHVAYGRREVGEEVYQARRAACLGCPEFRPARDSCAQCGCKLAVKARWSEQRCPLGRWPVGVEELNKGGE